MIKRPFSSWVVSQHASEKDFHSRSRITSNHDIPSMAPSLQCIFFLEWEMSAKLITHALHVMRMSPHIIITIVIVSISSLGVRLCVFCRLIYYNSQKMKILDFFHICINTKGYQKEHNDYAAKKLPCVKYVITFI